MSESVHTRQIGSIKTKGAYLRNNRDLSHSQRVSTGTGAPPPPKPRKYGNTKVDVDGHTFDSKKEAGVYVQLRALEKAGVVRNIELQPRFEFPLRGKPLRYMPRVNKKGTVCKGYPITYRADFSYEEKDGDKWVKRIIDVKGFDTQISRLKRSMVWNFHGVMVEIV